MLEKGGDAILARYSIFSLNLSLYLYSRVRYEDMVTTHGDMVK